MHIFLYYLSLIPGRLPAALGALLLTTLIGLMTGPWANNANPFFWQVTDRALGGLGIRLDRQDRSAGDLILRGTVLAAVGIVLFTLAGLAVRSVSTRIGILIPHSLPRRLADILFLWPALSTGAVWVALARLQRALKGKAGKGAYLTLARSTRTDFSGADDYAITRAGMRFAARSFDKGVVAPIVWYLLCGLTGAYIYAGLAALAWHFGRGGFSKGFGLMAQGFEMLMGYVPSLLAGLLLALATLFTPTGNPLRALGGLFPGKGRAPYASGGVPLAVLAWGLKVGLGGPSVDLDGRTHKDGWIGPAKASVRLESGHLKRALYMVIVACLLFMALLAAGNLLTSAGFFNNFRPGLTYKVK